MTSDPGNEIADLTNWVKKLSIPAFLGIYNTFIEGNRSELFHEYSLNPVNTLNDLQRLADQFVRDYNPQTDIELIELYTMKCFLIIARLLWLFESQQLTKTYNLLLDITFEKVFRTDPLSDDQLTFFIDEFETRTRNAEGGEFFDAELRIAEKHYYDTYHVERGNTVADFATFIEFFLEKYEADSQNALRDISVDAYYYFYLVLLLLCKIHMYTNVLEPSAVDD
jgi:hypothetical protein